MDLTLEERARIYEEERARREAEETSRQDGSGTFGFSSNLVGLLCYLGMWVTGIIFLVLDQKNRFVRFHAAQSIITFGALMLLGIILRPIPVAGVFLAAASGILSVVLWLVLMTMAYRNELYRLPVAAELAEALLKAVSPGVSKEATKAKAEQRVILNTAPAPRRSRSKDIAESVFAIIGSLVMLVLLNIAYEYIAYYSLVEGVWVRQRLVTFAWHSWLPMVNVAIVLTIVGHIIMITASGGRLVRETVHIILDVFAIIVLGSLFSIFPFDFSPLPAPATLVAFWVRLGIVIAVAVIAATVVVRSVRTVVAVVRN
ncbi:MAG: hypothetical protein FWH51_02245 [Dehalococcoidia bacterium]|nr:hypothetical protein [Dehalococcoidia bacterium]